MRPTSEEEDGQIAIANADASSRRVVTQGPGNRESPDWSPDGRSILFSLWIDDLPTHLFVLDVASGAARDVSAPGCTDPCIGDGDGSWSADGQEIVFWRAIGPVVNNVAASLAIWIMNTDGTGLRQVTTPPALSEDHFPRLSPDGKTIVFTRFDYTTGSERDAIFTVATGGGPVAQVTDWPAGASGATWSPDGRQLVFTERTDAARGDSTNVVVARPDGSSVRAVTSYSGAEGRMASFFPTFSPDGSWIVFAHLDQGNGRADLWMVAAAGGSPVRLTTDPSHEDQPDWTLTS